MTTLWVYPFLHDITIYDGAIIGGIVIDPDVVRLAIRNTAVEAGGYGINSAPIHQCVLEGNRIGASTGYGILVTCNGCRIVNNVVSAPSGPGIEYYGDGSTVQGNTIRNCGEEGLYVQGHYNHIEGNVMTDNDQFGLYLHPSSADNVYRRKHGEGQRYRLRRLRHQQHLPRRQLHAESDVVARAQYPSPRSRSRISWSAGWGPSIWTTP